MLDQAGPREPMVFSSILTGEMVPVTGGGLPNIEDNGNKFREHGQPLAPMIRTCLFFRDILALLPLLEGSN